MKYKDSFILIDVKEDHVAVTKYSYPTMYKSPTTPDDKKEIIKSCPIVITVENSVNEKIVETDFYDLYEIVGQETILIGEKAELVKKLPAKKFYNNFWRGKDKTEEFYENSGISYSKLMYCFLYKLIEQIRNNEENENTDIVISCNSPEERIISASGFSDVRMVNWNDDFISNIEQMIENIKNEMSSLVLNGSKQKLREDVFQIICDLWAYLVDGVVCNVPKDGNSRLIIDLTSFEYFQPWKTLPIEELEQKLLDKFKSNDFTNYFSKQIDNCIYEYIKSLIPGIQKNKDYNEIIMNTNVMDKIVVQIKDKLPDNFVNGNLDMVFGGNVKSSWDSCYNITSAKYYLPSRISCGPKNKMIDFMRDKWIKEFKDYWTAGVKTECKVII